MLLDIDLDELKFLIEPSYEFLKDKIPYIMEAYIKVYGEEYREHIKENFDKVDYIFLTTIDYYRKFIDIFAFKLMREVYHQINQTIELNSEYSNYVNDLLADINYDPYLDFLRKNIRGYLVDLRNTEHNIEKQKLLDSQIKLVDDILIKFDRIMDVLLPKVDQMRPIYEKNEQKRIKMQKEFISKHQKLLNDSEKQYIIEHPYYDVKDFIKKSEKLKYYISCPLSDDDFDVFIVGDILCFDSEFDNSSAELIKQREKILAELVSDYKNYNLNLNDGAALLDFLQFTYVDKFNFVDYGKIALKLLKEELKVYKQDFKYEMADYNRTYKYIIFIYDFIKKYINPVLDREFKKINIIYDNASLLSIGYEFLISFLKNTYSNNYLSLYRKDYGNNLGIQIQFLCLNQLDWMSFKSDGKIEIEFNEILGHELGHVATIRDNNTGLGNGNDLENFNELLNQYTNVKKDKYLDERGILFKSSCFVNAHKLALARINLFLLEPLVAKYERQVLDASINNNVNIIIDFMGEDLFNEYIGVINSFHQHQREKYQKARQIFEEEPDYVESIKQRINDIMNRVDERNLESGRKKK